jgi:hypothetical protein
MDKNILFFDQTFGNFGTSFGDFVVWIWLILESYTKFLIPQYYLNSLKKPDPDSSSIKIKFLNHLLIYHVYNKC